MRTYFILTPVPTLTLEMTTQEVAAFMAYSALSSESEQWTAGSVLQRQMVYAKNDIPDSVKRPIEIKVLIVPNKVTNKKPK